LHQGQPTAGVATNLRLNPKTVREIGRRYQDAKLDRALYDKKRPGAASLLTKTSANGSSRWFAPLPPKGYARWTVRLVAEEALKRKLVPGVGRETIRILLQDHDLQPWAGENVACSRTER
jgi:putative transposase